MSEHKILLNCDICGLPLEKTDNPQVYKCPGCENPYKVEFKDGIISIKKIEKKIDDVKRLISLKERLENNKEKVIYFRKIINEECHWLKNIGCSIFGLIFIIIKIFDFQTIRQHPDSNNEKSQSFCA